jgi:hypothetical protein
MHVRRIFHLFGDIIIAGGRLQNVGLPSPLIIKAFLKAGRNIATHLLW